MLILRLNIFLIPHQIRKQVFIFTVLFAFAFFFFLFFLFLGVVCVIAHVLFLTVPQIVASSESLLHFPFVSKKLGLTLRLQLSHAHSLINVFFFYALFEWKKLKLVKCCEK